MSTYGLIGAVVLVIIALVGIGWPFIRRRTPQVEAARAQKQHDELLTTYERVLATIRDLDDDFRSEKLSPEAYQQQRTYWTEQGIALLQQLEPDHMEANDEDSDEPVASVPDDEDDAVEQAIRAYRQARAGT